MKPLRYVLSAVFAVAVWLLWWLKYPELLLFQEQNQLFLYTWPFVGERLSVCGGLADLVAEFLTQFYYLPWLGASLLAITLTAIQLCVWRLAGDKRCAAWYPLSFIPSLLLLTYMGDHDVKLCFAVALLMVLGLCILYDRRPSVPLALISIAAGYWLAGPAVILLALYIPFRDRKPLELLYAVFAFAAILIFRLTLLQQYPWRQLLLGLDYYRMPLHQGAMEVICAFSALLIPILLAVLPDISRFRTLAFSIESVVLAALAVFGVHLTIDTPATEIIAYDQLVRQEKWAEVVSRATERQPKSDVACVCLNLSLFMTGQMDHMQNYWQAGPQGLIMPRVRDNISNSGSSEVFWRLGFVNEALRYAFDSQESIADFRKSGRWLSRMAECQIVNGRYEVASKYLDLLKHSLFYRSWALEHEKYLGNEALVASNPVYNYLRVVRSHDNYLYYYPEMDKMLYKLYAQNKNNIMAAWYCRAWNLLSEDEKVQDSPAGGAHGN